MSTQPISSFVLLLCMTSFNWLELKDTVQLANEDRFAIDLFCQDCKKNTFPSSRSKLIHINVLEWRDYIPRYICRSFNVFLTGMSIVHFHVVPERYFMFFWTLSSKWFLRDKGDTDTWVTQEKRVCLAYPFWQELRGLHPSPTTWSAAEEENRKLQVLQYHGIVSFTFGKWNSPTAVERMRYRSGFKMHQAQFGWWHMRLLLQRLEILCMQAADTIQELQVQSIATVVMQKEWFVICRTFFLVSQVPQWMPQPQRFQIGLDIAAKTLPMSQMAKLNECR